MLIDMGSSRGPAAAVLIHKDSRDTVHQSKGKEGQEGKRRRVPAPQLSCLVTGDEQPELVRRTQGLRFVVARSWPASVAPDGADTFWGVVERACSTSMRWVCNNTCVLVMLTLGASTCLLAEIVRNMSFALVHAKHFFCVTHADMPKGDVMA